MKLCYGCAYLRQEVCPPRTNDKLRCYYGSLLSDKAEYLAVDPIWEPESHWDDHPDYCVADWQYDVSEGNTRQSYIEWVNSAMAADADERHHTGGGK